MFIRKCDLCKKETKDIVVIRIERPSGSVDLCYACSEPVLEFLRKNKIIDENNREIELT
ncbi:MAG: hypothetical protein WC389_17235 [Lutibacter sp.]|jgi:hypothetical protein